MRAGTGRGTHRPVRAPGLGGRRAVETPEGTIKRTWGVMERTQPMMDKLIHRDREPPAHYVSPAAVSARTGVAVSILQVTCPLHRPCQGICWAGKARVGTHSHGHTHSCDSACEHEKHRQRACRASRMHTSVPRAGQCIPAPNPLAAGPWGGWEPKGSHQSNKSPARHPSWPLPGS